MALSDFEANYQRVSIFRGASNECPETIQLGNLSSTDDLTVPLTNVLFNKEICPRDDDFNVGNNTILRTALQFSDSQSIRVTADRLRLSVFNALNAETDFLVTQDPGELDCGGPDWLMDDPFLLILISPNDTPISVLGGDIDLASNQRHLVYVADDDDINDNDSYGCVYAAAGPADATPIPGTNIRPGDITDDDPICFPASGTVELESGERKTMSELAIGDRVRVSPKEFSEVFMFTHRVSHSENSFVNVHIEDSVPITLTPGHYMYVNGKLAPARTIIPGDLVELGNGNTVPVMRVSHSQETGLYNPQTVQGDIIVNGIRASTYTTTVQQPFAHALLAPMRAMFNAFGVTTDALNNGADFLAAVAPKGL